MPMNTYFIGHLQSPTSTTFSFHPAEQVTTESQRHYLWMNGQMDSLAHQKYKKDGILPWDTGLFLDNFISEGVVSSLNSFQGSFACLYLVEGQGLYAFRNAIAPLYYKGSSLCSVSFDDARKLDKNILHQILTTKVNPFPTEVFANDYNPFGVD